MRITMELRTRWLFHAFHPKTMFYCILRLKVFTSVLLVICGCTGSDSASGAKENVSLLADTPFVTAAAKRSENVIIDKANTFITTISESQRAALIQPYTFSNASRWHTYPQLNLGHRKARLGLPVKELSMEQLNALFVLLSAATGSNKNDGFDEIKQHMEIDNWISQKGTRAGYGSGEFYIAFLGMPSVTGTWQLQFGGHHLALNNTYRDGVLVGATPSFRAIEPNSQVQYNGVILEPQYDEWKTFVELLASLNTDQVSEAELGKKQVELLLGPEATQKDWNFPTNTEGTCASAMSEHQRALLMKLISLYVNDISDADAELIITRYKNDIDATYLSFSGSRTLSNTGDYVRINGPSVWIELVMDPPYSTNKPHVHAVWRDKHTDYGGTRPPDVAR